LIQNIKLSHDGVMTASDKISSDKTRLDEIRLDKTKTKPSREIALVSDGFDEFWSLYPNKVGKEAARKAWAKAKPGIDNVLHALGWQINSEQWKKNGGQFIPNPSTYINQGRWQDEQKVEELW